MIPDLALVLLFFSDQNLWDKYHNNVKLTAVSPEVRVILSDLEEYYVRGIETGIVNLDNFATWFHQVQHPDFGEVTHQLYNLLFTRISEQTIEKDSEFVKSILTQLKYQAAKKAIQEHLEAGSWSPETVKQIVENFDEDKYFTDTRLCYSISDPATIFAAVERSKGLQWPLTCLQKSIGRLLKGDFGLVAAYVDTGKTAFMVSLAAYFAQQIEDGDVLYFNNEGSNSIIQSRCWSAVLKKTQDQITQDLPAATEDYLEAMHGDMNRIKIFNCDGWRPSDIKFVAKHFNPKLILVDMLDKLSMDSNKDAAEHLRVGNLYMACRSIAKEFCPVIGTSQCDQSVTYVDKETGEEKFVHYIPMRSLAESKVTKQAEMDFMITIGKDKKYPMTRYINVPKNKLPGIGNPAYRYMQSECQFNEQYSLYED